MPVWYTGANGTIVKDSIENILNAKSAGLDVEVAISACRARSVEEEVSILMTYLANVPSRYWVGPWNDHKSKCGW